jgi:glucose-6-phosphate-specific signal transduction histidine kinase
MASKKTAKKKAVKKSPKVVLELSVKAQKEVRKLLKQDRAGSLTRKKLETGLEEIEDYLKVMEIHIHSSLP